MNSPFNKRSISISGPVLATVLISLLIVGGVFAYSAITGGSNGTVTSTATPATLQVTTVSCPTGGTPSFSQLSATCTGWSIGQDGSNQMTISVKNTGGTTASPVVGTSGVSPSDATCTFTTNPTSIGAGATVDFVLTYTAGQTTGTAACSFSIS